MLTDVRLISRHYKIKVAGCIQGGDSEVNVRPKQKIAFAESSEPDSVM